MTETILIRKNFKSAIQRGTGEAHLLMQSHPNIDFSSQIIKACIKNFAYDGECEQGRDTYLFELIELAGRKERIRSSILKALVVPQRNTWDLSQLLELALLFARQGDKEARQAIYDIFVSNTKQGMDWIGTTEIVELDRTEGLMFIAEAFGKRLESDPDDWHDEGLVRFFHDKNPDTDAWALLDAAAEGNNYIKTYTACVREVMARRNEERGKEPPVYADIVEELLVSKKRFRFWARKLSDADVLFVAQRLLIEKNRKNLEKLLPVFAHYRFPLDSRFILNMAKHGANKKIRQQAVNTLQFLEGDEIRQFAIDNITTVKNTEDFVIVLRSNYKTGDSQLLTTLVEQCNSPNSLEWLTKEYKEIYRDNKTPECAGPLEAIYDKHTCGICRADIVDILIANDALSDKIKDEIKFDCNKQTRDLYDGIIGKQI